MAPVSAATTVRDTASTWSSRRLCIPAAATAVSTVVAPGTETNRAVGMTMTWPSGTPLTCRTRRRVTWIWVTV
jgi:hypothetical protein